MAIKNRKCLCDNVKYSYCPDCSRADKLKPSYFTEFCSEDCMTIWTTATKYNMGKLTKSEAKEIISAINLKPIESYAQCVQRDLKVILAEEKKSRRVKPAPVVEQVKEVAVEETPAVIEHEVVTQSNE